MSTTTDIRAKIGGLELTGKPHPLSVYFILALRLMMGYAFLYSGIDKLTAAEPFNAQGYLVNAVPAASPATGLYEAMGTTPWFVDFVNVAVPVGEVLIGAAVLVGAFTRFAAFWGAFMMLLFYFGNWSVQHGYVNGDFAYMLVFLSIAALGAGRIIGVDNYLEDTEIVKKYPRLKYLLG